MKKNKIPAAWYFLAVVTIFYISVWITTPGAVPVALDFSLGIFWGIIPVFIFVFLFMILLNLYIKPKSVARHLGQASGFKKWFFAVVGGIISSGPAYMWYPVLKELKKKGVNYGFIATFLYNRAIKLPLIPLVIFYFGLKFTIILTVIMILFSVFQGVVIEKIMELKDEN